jgi:hypothetical protein
VAEQYADPAPAPGDSGLGDPGRPDKRTKPDSGSNEADRPNDLQDDDDSGLQPVNPASGSGASATGGGSGTKSKSPASSKGSKKGPNAPRIDDENPESGKVPAIRLDEKVAWRSAPTRTRIEARTHAASARLVRLPAYPASDWLPVDSESKVARRK